MSFLGGLKLSRPGLQQQKQRVSIHVERMDDGNEYTTVFTPAGPDEMDTAGRKRAQGRTTQQVIDPMRLQLATHNQSDSADLPVRPKLGSIANRCGSSYEKHLWKNGGGRLHPGPKTMCCPALCLLALGGGARSYVSPFTGVAGAPANGLQLSLVYTQRCAVSRFSAQHAAKNTGTAEVPKISFIALRATAPTSVPPYCPGERGDLSRTRRSVSSLRGCRRGVPIHELENARDPTGTT